MDVIELLKVVILGIVEGITEWLPISSTGHMILVDEFLKLNATDDFITMFFVVIQLGAIFAVILIYWKKIFPFYSKSGKVCVDTDIMKLWSKIIVASIPCGVLGLMFNDWFEENFQNFRTVSIALFVYGVLFIIIEKWNKERLPKVNKLSELTYSYAFFIGVFQLLSLIPGTSRSGSTIIGALLIGVSRTVAAEFTFYLAIPVMFGASFLKMVKFGFHYTSDELTILVVGTITAFIVSYYAIKFLIGYIKKNDFTVFGYYRIVLAIILFLYMLFA